jgi:hypothetical protein
VALIDMLADPIYLRRFIQSRPMTATEIDELATRVVAAFTPHRPLEPACRLSPMPVPVRQQGKNPAEGEQ